MSRGGVVEISSTLGMVYIAWLGSRDFEYSRDGVCECGGVVEFESTLSDDTMTGEVRRLSAYFTS